MLVLTCPRCAVGERGRGWAARVCKARQARLCIDGRGGDGLGGSVLASALLLLLLLGRDRVHLTEKDPLFM